MAMKNNKKKRIIIFCVIAAVFLIALFVSVYLIVFKNDKSDATQQVTIDDLTEKIPEPEKPDPAEVLASAAYKDGIIEKATVFRDDCASKYPDISDDLARFSLIDIDKDEIPELIMHDVPGKMAYYCSYALEGISEPFEIFICENSDESSYIPCAYAALYFEKNLFIKYNIKGNYDETESYIYRVNEETKAPELIGQVSAKKDSEGNYSYFGSDGSEVSKEDYCAVFKDALGDDYGRFFLDELMLADGEFDFNLQYVFNSTAAVSHMTFEELTSYIASN